MCLQVRPVLAGQTGDGPQWEGLKYLDAVQGPPATFVHATANAPYVVFIGYVEHISCF